MGGWDAWLGREATQSDTLDPALARRWLGTFDLDTPADGIMPQGIHLCLCAPEAPGASLGTDGHPQRDESDDSFFPPIPLPRRMWAASEITFKKPLQVGCMIERISRIAAITEKQGKSGTLGFVEVEHATIADGEEAIRETQTLVYRDAAPVDAPLSPPPATDGVFETSEWESCVQIMPDPRLLFRFSALTFNTHRIHYDLPYARDVERYRGLVVHGPLMASMLLQMAAAKLSSNQLSHFSFRAISPAIADEPLYLAMRQDGPELELGTFAGDGRQCVTARATTK